MIMIPVVWIVILVYAMTKLFIMVVPTIDGLIGCRTHSILSQIYVLTRVAIFWFKSMDLCSNISKEVMFAQFCGWVLEWYRVY